MKAGDRAPKFPFNRTDYVHVGEEIILREGSNLKGSRGLMPISAHLIQSYVNAIDESKRKYAAEHKTECNLEEKTENTNDTNDENKAEDTIEDKADENIEDKVGRDTEENAAKNTEENTVENTEEMAEENAEMIPEIVETNDNPEVESKPEESIENEPIPDSGLVSEAPIETPNNLADSSSVEDVIEEEITVPSIHSPLIDVPILL